MPEKDDLQSLIEVIVEKLNKLINLPLLDEKQEASLIRMIITFLISLLSELKLLKSNKDKEAN